MKAFKKISQNQLIGLVTVVFVILLLVVLYVAKVPEGVEETFDPNEVPPMVSIDTSYNATLSGEPFYIVEDDDERFDDSLDVCNDLGSDSYRRDVQNFWYQVVAYEDGLTVEDVIFEQINVEEGDKMVAVIYDSEDQEFMAWPNKLIIDSSGDNVELLERDYELEKGEVVAVSVDKDTEYCFDYSEVGSHENIDLKWNLVSKPDVEKVDYRAIWEVAFAKGGDSLEDPERYYSYTDPSDSVNPVDLTDTELYWVYGGEPQKVVDGGDLGEDPNTPVEDEQKIVVKVANSIDGSNVAGQRDVVEGETFQINENGGEVRYSVGLLEPADGEVELEFEIYEDGTLVEVQDAEEILSRSVAAGEGAFARGKNFRDGESTLTAFNLVAKDDDLAEIPKSVEFKVVDKAGVLDEVSFKIDIIDDETGATACTLEARPGLVVKVEGLKGEVLKDATVIAMKDGVEVERLSETLLGSDFYSMLLEQDGEYDVRIEKAGVASKSFSVVIEKDECHVITEERVVVLENDSLVTLNDEGDVVGFGPESFVAAYLEKPAGAEAYNVLRQDQILFSSEIESAKHSVKILDDGKVLLNLSDIVYKNGENTGQVSLEVEYAESDAQDANTAVGSYVLKVDKP
jgi:hypothetical protein